MQSARKIAMYATLAAIGELAFLSICGAFLGASAAKAFFNTPPMAGFWFFLLALLVGCFIVDWRLVRSPGLAAMHLGAAAILIGSMWSSDAGHLAADWLLDRQKPPYGHLRIAEGGEAAVLRDAGTGRAVGTLPFAVRLRDFRIEYYPGGEWGLWFQHPVPAGVAAQEGLTEIDWQVGEAVRVEGTGLRIRVLEFHEHARPILGDGGEVVGAEPDPESDTAAMEIEATLRDRTHRGWIVVPGGREMGGMGLDPLVPEEVAAHSGLAFWLSRPRRMPKDYFSDVEVLEDGEVVREATIEVNHPLHWGGYHLYQSSYEMGRHQVATVLAVRSDSGLYVVYTGFVLLVLGTAVRFWIEHPVKRLLRWSRLRQPTAAEGG